jgi:hypothetical protein
VVLFSLLLFGGIGSYLTQGIRTDVIRSTLIRLSTLLVVLVLASFVTPIVITQFAETTTAIRVLVAVVLLFPLGLFMGMAFPLGMKLASEQASTLTAWLWGVNGATSICASVLAVAISLNWGISVTSWTGIVCYLVALAASVWLSVRLAWDRRLV